MDWGWMSWITPTHFVRNISHSRPVAELAPFRTYQTAENRQIPRRQNGIYSKGRPDIRQKEGKSQHLLCDNSLLIPESFRLLLQSPTQRRVVVSSA